MVIAKILDMAALQEVLRGVSIRAGQPGQDNWNCVSWVREALEALQRTSNVLGTAVLDWDTVRDSVMNFAQRKVDERHFESTGAGAGAGAGAFDNNKPATYEFIDGKELYP